MAEPDVDRLIRDLAARADRVSPLWPPALRAAAWFATGVAVLGLGTAGALRPDLGARLREPRFLLDLASTAALAALLAWLACLAAVPGRRPARASWLLVAAAAATVLGLVVLMPADLRQPLSTFLAAGLHCLRNTTLMALLPIGLLLVTLRRGAPVAPGRAGLLAGAAGWLLAYLFVRLTCPLEEALHLWAWHLAPAVAAAGGAAALGAVWLDRWKHAREGGGNGGDRR